MSDSRVESTILRNLIFNEDFARRVLPYIKDEYFRQTGDKVLFTLVNDHVAKYNNQPTTEAIKLAVSKHDGLVEDTFNEIEALLEEFEVDKNVKVEQQWLTDTTEEFCRERAMYNAAIKTVAIMEGKEKKLERGAIPGLYEEALAISFDPSVGHDYLEDAEAHYDRIHANTAKLKFDIDICNQVTKGGVGPGTLNVLAAGVYVGKTLGLCALTKGYMQAGQDVLYITLEISEDGIASRVDSNLLNLTMEEADLIPKKIYLQKVEKVRAVTPGKLIIKEYPAGSVHVNNFRALLHELWLKKKFKPKVIMIDYLNLCASSRVKASDKTHITIQAVAEELRALGQEFKIPIWSATQLDAEGMGSTDPGMTNISGSKVGLSATLDLLWMLVSSDKLKELGQILVIQHKNRYKDVDDFKKFFIGVDRKKMRWHSVEQKAQPKEESPDDPLAEDAAVKREVTKKYGEAAYESGYKHTQQAKAFGPRDRKNLVRGKTSFANFTV